MISSSIPAVADYPFHEGAHYDAMLELEHDILAECGETICDLCFDEECFICDYCEEGFHNDDICNTGYHKDEKVCLGCFEENYICCDECEEGFLEDDLMEVHVYTTLKVCCKCYDKNFFCCSVCENDIPLSPNNLHEDGQESLCRECYVTRYPNLKCPCCGYIKKTRYPKFKCPCCGK